MAPARMSPAFAPPAWSGAAPASRLRHRSPAAPVAAAEPCGWTPSASPWAGANTQPAGETDEARLALGFAEVQLNASERISASHKGSLRVYQRLDGYVAGEGLHYSGGDLRLSTPLLTGEAVR